MEGKEYLADIHHRHGTGICNHQFGLGDVHGHRNIDNDSDIERFASNVVS